MTIKLLRQAFEEAQAATAAARGRLLGAIEAKNPHPVGSEFERCGMKYQVRRVTPQAHGSGTGLWLECYYWTSAKRWSQSTKTLWVKITDDMVEVS